MRRKEREVTDLQKIEQVLAECAACRIALWDENAPYIVPLSFGYEIGENGLILYFHCANAGKKIDLIKKDPRAGFETDVFRQLVTAEKACGYTAKYASVTGWGNIEIVTDSREKAKGLAAVMRHYTGRSDFDFSPAECSAVCVLKLTAGAFSCKENA